MRRRTSVRLPVIGVQQIQRGLLVLLLLGDLFRERADLLTDVLELGLALLDLRLPRSLRTGVPQGRGAAIAYVRSCFTERFCARWVVS